MQVSMVDLLSKVDSGRCVGIEISNKTTSVTLSSPSTYCESGYVHSPPPPTISPNATDYCVFVKKALTARGSVGVLTYHYSTSHTIAILFSNPFDYNLHSIYFGVWITDQIRKADHTLYNEMYYNKHPSTEFKCVDVKRHAQALEVFHGNLKVLATMSNDYKAILKLDIVETDK
ncbi:DELTA-thalatoxin-Avl1a-like [Xenopus laevis]|uniref:DELTA-thalatoxin-Avl1a-like n=1 Tax=Xenopus laevis TaxID=8355 RepID=A0A8J1LSA3_XENLA|nr:DELTA-thalatoxin-Avl1a-like [Xenopus laevis]